MAASHADRRAALLFAAVLSIASGFSAWAAGPQQRRSEDVFFDGEDLNINSRTNSVTVRNVVITQGDCSIRAAAAQATGSGLSFDNSTWDFRGSVNIRCQGGNLTADDATLKFANSRFARTTVNGSPAQFAQAVPELDKPARGTAGTIQYDFASGDVRLSKDAWLSAALSNSGYEWKSECVVYNVRDRGAHNCGAAAGPGAPAASGESGRVHLRIRPGSSKPEMVTPDQAGETAVPPAPAPGRNP